LKLDAIEIAGVLNFRMSRGFAVDDKLHSFLATHNNLTTASICEMLKKMAADEWTNDATFCCRACLAKRVRTTNRNGSVFVQGTNQSALHSVLVPMTDQMKRFRGDRHQLVCLQRELQAVEDAFDGDVQFVNMFKKKKIGIQRICRSVAQEKRSV